MARTPVWKTIASALDAEIAAGHYRPGDRLPTEAALSARFDVNRHTVRRALADLVERGMVHTRRGSGAFVTARSTDYPLSRRPRFHRSITDAGRAPSRRVLSLESRAADAREAEALQIPTGAPVHIYEALSFIDDVPTAISRSVFPAGRLPGLLDRLAEQPSITHALAGEGVSDYTRASTRITAKLATATQALLLAIREGDPILRSIAINVAPDGTPVEYGHAWFAGDRLTLTLHGDDA
ncbi:phosphonate metabolism transcriptional regulator PhnF [Aliiruegeria lutimaris]|uniref:Transcriptional regulator, GntR family n=1 Tax=Aliiruegeria lutimaris TaxID=571298 RepID=A0A1G9BXH1_9RHOB|nr:phosphonate metabolism transcriptional regulator PhnF [Aliiruegeria lutimaris]SDK44090.1 transcriptional regulator, GntR family [Aliiruegeria lutimaris]